MLQRFHACEAEDANGDVIDGIGQCHGEDSCEVGPFTIEGGATVTFCMSTLYGGMNEVEISVLKCLY